MGDYDDQSDLSDRDFEDHGRAQNLEIIITLEDPVGSSGGTASGLPIFLLTSPVIPK